MARAWLVLGAAVIFAASVQAYVLYDHTWPSATTTFNMDIAGADGKWNTSFEQAMDCTAPDFLDRVNPP